MYADKGGSKCIIRDKGGEFSSEVMFYIAYQLGFTKVYTSPYSPNSNSVIKRCHSFLKNSIREMRCNHDVELDGLVHIAKMAYNIFPHLAAGESPFFLMYGRDAYLPALHRLLQPRFRYTGDNECRIHLNALREIYMIAILNLKMSHDQYPPPTGFPQNTDLKTGDHAPHLTFDAKYKPSYCIVNCKMKRVSAEHVQFMYPAEYYFTTLPQKEIFGRTAKYINHLNLMLDLYKDLGETNKKQGHHSGKQNHPDNSNITTHNYNLHLRIAPRL